MVDIHTRDINGRDIIYCVGAFRKRNIIGGMLNGKPINNWSNP